MEYYRIDKNNGTTVAYYRFDKANLRVTILFCDTQGAPNRSSELRYTKRPEDMEEFRKLRELIDRSGNEIPSRGPKIFAKAGLGKPMTSVFIEGGFARTKERSS